MDRNFLVVGDNSVLFLSVLYGVSCLLMFNNFLRFQKSKREKKLFNICHLMYIIIYSIVPMLVHFYVYEEGTKELHYYVLNYSADDIVLFYVSFLFSIIGYYGLIIGYKIKCFDNIVVNHQTYTISAYFWTSLVCLLIGIVCLFLWTKAFGGPIEFLTYASLIRSGIDVGVENSFTLFKRFVPLVQFANIVFYALWLRTRRVIYIPFAIISFGFSLLYLLANDGRAPTVMHFFALVWIYLSIGRKSQFSFTRKNVFGILILGGIALFLMHNADKISEDLMNKESQDEKKEYSFDILSSIREEFSYTVRSNQAIFKYVEDNPTTFRMPIEIISGILGVLPSSFRPESIEKLEVLNTRNWTSSRSEGIYFGGRPPDIIVTGIYTLNIIGVFVLPYLLGVLLKYLDTKRSKIKSVFDNNIYFGLVMYPVLRFIPYCDFDGLILNFFYIFIGYALLYTISKIQKRNRQRLHY